MAVLRLFAAAREAAGTGRDVVDGATVADVLATARARYGEPFASVLRTANVWVNGEPAGPDADVGEADEVAVLPPVSGGCGTDAPSDAEGPAVPVPGRSCATFPPSVWSHRASRGTRQAPPAVRGRVG